MTKYALGALTLCGLLQAQPFRPTKTCEPPHPRPAARLRPVGTSPHIEYGVNHYAFDDSTVGLLRQLDPSKPVPTRIEFNWNLIEPAAGLLDFTSSDRMVSLATRAGVPLLG